MIGQRHLFVQAAGHEVDMAQESALDEGPARSADLCQGL